MSCRQLQPIHNRKVTTPHLQRSFTKAFFNNRVTVARIWQQQFAVHWPTMAVDASKVYVPIQKLSTTHTLSYTLTYLFNTLDPYLLSQSSSLSNRPSSPPPKDAPDLTPNPRGIPALPFMSSVSDYVSALADVEPTLRRFQEMISKYQFMEANKQKHAQSLREKIPEMKNTLDTVKFLRRQKTKKEESEVQELETTFPLADTLYAKAVVRPAELEEVYLWLGANVMVAYPLGEAEEMLTGKLETARESLKAAEEDLEFLRVQITTLEVATARVYNWDVMEKRRLKAEGKLVDEQGAEGEGDGDGKGGG